jgi:hypothetical protein
MFIFIFDEYSTEMSCSYSTNIREYEYEYEYVEYSPIPDYTLVREGYPFVLGGDRTNMSINKLAPQDTIGS